MGTPDSRYLGNQDYGRRLYVDNAPYAEQMGVGSRKPAFNQNDALYKQSEFKKPYKEDDYEEMEYLSDSYPGFNNDFEFDTPLELPYPGAGYTPWLIKFYCFSEDICYCYKELNCTDIYCEWPITLITVKDLPAGCEFIYTGNLICAKCPEGETSWIVIDINMLATFKHNGATVKVNGIYGSMNISACDDSDCCDATGIAWDSAGSASTIAREASATVAITDSTEMGGPYTWSVSGTGFTLDDATTVGLTNTLNADATACGSAEITVTGCDGTVVTGYVRCTTGVWGTWNVICQAPGYVGCPGNNQCNVISGNRKDMACAQCMNDSACVCNGTELCTPPGTGYAPCDGYDCNLPDCFCSGGICDDPDWTHHCTFGITISQYALWVCA